MRDASRAMVKAEVLVQYSSSMTHQPWMILWTIVLCHAVTVSHGI